MYHDENSDDKNKTRREERLKRIMGRVSDKDAFISDMEGYVDQAYPEEEPSKMARVVSQAH